MLYSKKLNLGYIHYPRTGGRSFEKFLLTKTDDFDRVFKDHEKLSLVVKDLDKFGVHYKDINVIGTIRNPFYVIPSLYYHWRRQYREEWSLKARRKHHVLCHLPFLGFVEWFLGTWPSYFEFFSLEGSIRSNFHIVMQENYYEDMRITLNGILKFKWDVAEITHMNKSDRIEDVMSLYTPSLIKSIKNKYKWAFENYYPEV